MFKRFCSYYKPYRKVFWLDMLCATLIAGCGVLFPILIRYLTTQVFRRADPAGILSAVAGIAGILLLSYIVQALCQYYVTLAGHMMGAHMESDMRHQLFEHMEKLSFSFYDQHSTGSLASRLLNDLFDITELAHHGPENIILSLGKLLGAFIFLLTLNAPVTAVLMVMTGLMVFFTYRLNRRMRQSFMDNRKTIASMNAVAQDSLSGIRTVASYNNQPVELKKFEQNNQRFLESKRRNYQVMAQFTSVNAFLQGLMYVSVILAGGWAVANGQMAASDMVIYILYINMFMDPIKTLIQFTEQFQKGATGFERMVEVLDTDPDIKDRPGAQEAGHLKGDIVFDRVTFHYEDDEPVLKDLSLRVRPGQTVALVGPSGAGKTTLCSLIPRFYDVSEGSVRVDGKDVRDYTLESLRSNIGVVQQEVYIFNQSLRDNIRYGRPDASDEEVEEAARQAHLTEFVKTLPEGYDTLCGEHGVRFSGGQKQRISIARVFLKNPSILILDEATSALDNQSEAQVQAALDALSKDRTTFVIAHRLSTIRNAHEILVLTEKGIEEQGSHEELIQGNGLYKELYNLQFRAEN